MPTRRQLANAIRALSMDAVQAANSGHPGMPMGMADIAEVLWNDFLRHSPANPRWPDRDRFVLSNGHGSMLLYAVLHLSGYPLSLEDIRHFRQMGAHTAGHPERDAGLGIETTTGPLGQGIANAVGLALAERHLAATFNRPGFDVVNHHTYVFLGDGCLMEGVSHEACSLAGTLGLGKLIAFYDDNGISIDGKVEGWFTDDTPRRFEAYGWQVIRGVDGHDPEAIKRAVRKARRETGKPSLICCRTVIGFGSPAKAGTKSVHGEALGAAEIAATRVALDWPHPPFEVPAEIRAGWDARSKGRRHESKWKKLFKDYRTAHPELAAEFERRQAGSLPDGFAASAAAALADAHAKAANVATRAASQSALNALAPALPEWIGGSADLTGSNNTWHGASRVLTAADPAGNYLHYGVREFGMAAIMNGLELHGGVRAYGGTFLVFSDYARNAIRMAALMRIGSVFVLSHDSIGLGEDGPTHQPIEQIASLRLIPHLTLWRPCDAVETYVAWADAIARTDGPTCLALTRQALPAQPRDAGTLDLVRRGGYVLAEASTSADLILLATGSEVAVAMAARASLEAAGIGVRVVSMPATRVFDHQDAAYRATVLPAGVPTIAVEAGVTDGWWRYVGARGRVLGIDEFGRSAPARELFQYYGIVPENVVRIAHELLGNSPPAP